MFNKYKLFEVSVFWLWLVQWPLNIRVTTLNIYTVGCDVHQRPEELRADVRPAGREGGRDVALLPRDRDREPRAEWNLRGARTHVGALGDPVLPHQLQPRMPEADCEPEPKRGAAMWGGGRRDQAHRGTGDDSRWRGPLGCAMVSEALAASKDIKTQL